MKKLGILMMIMAMGISCGKKNSSSSGSSLSPLTGGYAVDSGASPTAQSNFDRVRSWFNDSKDNGSINRGVKMISYSGMSYGAGAGYGINIDLGFWQWSSNESAGANQNSSTTVFCTFGSSSSVTFKQVSSMNDCIYNNYSGSSAYSKGSNADLVALFSLENNSLALYDAKEVEPGVFDIILGRITDGNVYYRQSVRRYWVDTKRHSILNPVLKQSFSDNSAKERQAF